METTNPQSIINLLDHYKILYTHYYNSESIEIDNTTIFSAALYDLVLFCHNKTNVSILLLNGKLRIVYY